MRKLKLLLLTPLVFILSSCGMENFQFAKKERIIDADRLLIGSYSTIKASTSENLENYLYLDFYNKETIRDTGSKEYSKVFNLSNSSLVKIDNNLVDDKGNPLLFLNCNDFINQYIGAYNGISDYFADGNKLDVFFSYGEIQSDFNCVTARTAITEGGAYYFGVVEETGQKPDFTRSSIYKEVIKFYNPISGKYE